MAPGRAALDVRAGRKVKVGDQVVFERKPREVLAIVEDGLWAPYFDLAEVGQVSHHLVELPRQNRKKETLSNA
jgi:hypothetical protein